MALKTAASQTVGPFFHGLLSPGLNDLVGPATRGERITIGGRLLDGDGAALANDGMVEIWQANAEGRYDHPEDVQELPRDPHFRGFGRCGTDADGAFEFQTIKPGPVAGPQGQLQAPHINLVVFARGLLSHLYTRLYFPGEPLNETDPWLSAVEPARRPTLIAAAEPGGGQRPRRYRFDVVLQGENETVFFDV